MHHISLQIQGTAPLTKKQILSEQDYSMLTEQYGSKFQALIW